MSPTVQINYPAASRVIEIADLMVHLLLFDSHFRAVQQLDLRFLWELICRRPTWNYVAVSWLFSFTRRSSNRLLLLDLAKLHFQQVRRRRISDFISAERHTQKKYETCDMNTLSDSRTTSRKINSRRVDSRRVRWARENNKINSFWIMFSSTNSSVLLSKKCSK